MTRIRLAKVLDREDVRQMCIKHNYYTKGDCCAYENMLSLVEFMPRSKYTGSNITADRLEEIAWDIKKHSDTEDSVKEIMENLCYYIKVELFEREV